MPEPLLPVASWLLHFLLHSTLLLGAVWLVDRLAPARLLATAAREHLWRAAILGALLSASVQSAGLLDAWPRVVPRLEWSFATAPRLPAPPAPPTPPTAATPPRTPRAPQPGLAGATALATEPASPAGAEWAVAPEPARPAALAPPRGAFDRLAAPLAERGPLALTLLWLAGALLAALRLAAVGLFERRSLRNRAPAGAPLRRELEALCAEQRCRVPALSVAPRVAGPLTLPSGEIVVPDWAVSALDPLQRRALLAHELAHRVRHDARWLPLISLLAALIWVQPLLRAARRRLVRYAEIEADAWAIRAGNEPVALAECLAECAERWLSHARFRAAPRFAAAMFSGESHDSPLLDRIDRLMKGVPMHAHRLSLPLRGTVALVLAAALFALPGCGIDSLRAAGNRFSSDTRIDGDGDTRVTVSRAGYSLRLEAEGQVTFAEDESDIATLEPGGEFELTEKLDGVKTEYRVVADASGRLTRTFRRNGVAVAEGVDEASRRWLAEALPRMFRESGFDARARVARLLARGGPELVLAEVELAGSDFAKSNYLGHLLATAELSVQQLDRVLAGAAKIDSDFELRQLLGRALESQTLDAALFVRLLETAREIGSSFEMSELLSEAAESLPAEPVARTAWLAAAAEIDSDFELRRSLEAALRSHGDDPAFVASLVALAGERMDSDFELRQVLEDASRKAGDPAVAAAYLAAVREIGSGFERKSALLELLDAAELGPDALRAALDATAGIGSDFEKREVLEKIARRVAADPDLARRYREIARGMNDFERGAALRAIDDAAL